MATAEDEVKTNGEMEDQGEETNGVEGEREAGDSVPLKKVNASDATNGDPTDATNGDVPTDAPKEDAPTDATNGDAPTDAPKEEVPTDAPKEDAPPDVPKEDAPTDAPKEDAPTDAPKEDTPTDAPKEDTPTNASTEDTETDAHKGDAPTETSNEDGPTDVPKDDTQAEVPSESPSSKEEPPPAAPAASGSIGAATSKGNAEEITNAAAMSDATSEASVTENGAADENGKSSAEKLAARGEVAKPDQYGQVHPTETPEFIARSLKALNTELDSIPETNESKKAWSQALEICPEQTGDDHKLMFLRCEVFDVKLAVARLLKYWTRRVELFGEDKGFLPLTLDKALKDDEAALSMEFLCLTGARDSEGRAVILVDPSKQDKSKYTRESFVRRVWYVLHAALEDEMTQQKGIVFVASPRRTKFSQFDRVQIRMNVESMRGRIPIRIGAIHICHPPTFFSVAFPVFKVFLGPVLRKRIQVHSGSTDKVLKRLATFGIEKSSVPADLGGDVKVDYQGWLAERRAAGL